MTEPNFNGQSFRDKNNIGSLLNSVKISSNSPDISKNILMSSTISKLKNNKYNKYCQQLQNKHENNNIYIDDSNNDACSYYDTNNNTINNNYIWKNIMKNKYSINKNRNNFNNKQSVINHTYDSEIKQIRKIDLKARVQIDQEELHKLDTFIDHKAVTRQQQIPIRK